MTLSQARNAIKRCLKEALDPTPSKKEVHRLWKYFDSSCCYCGTKVKQNDRTGHIDHLVPESAGGRNSISNRVLSCSICNGDLKLDSNWEDYLSRVCGKKDGNLFLARKTKIEEWIRGKELNMPEQEKVAIENAFQEVNSVLSDVINRLRTE